MQITLDNEGSGELYLKIMKAICGDTEGKSMADLMSFHSPYNSQLGFSERIYVDIQNRPLDNKEEQKYFHNIDVIRFLKRGKYYDTMICADGIEHLSPAKGRLLIYLMEKYSAKQVIFTPLGAYNITSDKNPDSHRSGWTPDYFQGWASIVLENFHPSLNTGAFFSWHCEDIKEDFQRVKQELKSIL